MGAGDPLDPVETRPTRQVDATYAPFLGCSDVMRTSQAILPQKFANKPPVTETGLVGSPFGRV
jgi:hypothetical protein